MSFFYVEGDKRLVIEGVYVYDIIFALLLDN